MSSKGEQVMSLRRYADLIRRQSGRVVRPYRADGFVNLLTKYGTSRDSSERYEFRQEPMVPDELLTTYYEGNGLFAKIIDTPAEEAMKSGFTLEGLDDQKLEEFYTEALDELDWEETAITCVKWARLFGGSIAVLLINDGRGLEEPVDWRNIRSIDDIRVYDRSLVQPDYASMFSYNPDDPFGTRGSRLGMPEWYDVYSRYGSFRVHDSRCLVFQNGVLPENTSNSVYQLWGMPEYVRLKRAMRDAEVAHGTATKMLDRSVQAIYKMRDMSAELATEEGEDRLLKRLQLIDMSRGLLNSIAIDGEGEEYDFRTFPFTGVAEVIDTTCNYLSALTCIPQTILFGRSPAGMNATGESDLENWYNYLERIQKRMIKKNLRYLLSIIFQAGVSTGEIDEVPSIDIKFNPLWSLSEQEEAALEQTKAATQSTRAATAAAYVQMGALDPMEVRKKLADSDEFDVESMLDEYTEEELMENAPQGQPGAEGGMPGAEGVMPGGAPMGAPAEGGGQPTQEKQAEAPIGKEKDKDTGGNAPAAAPAATKLPQDMSEKEKAEAKDKGKKKAEPKESTKATKGEIERAIEIEKAMQIQGGVAEAEKDAEDVEGTTEDEVERAIEIEKAIALQNGTLESELATEGEIERAAEIVNAMEIQATPGEIEQAQEIQTAMEIQATEDEIERAQEIEKAKLVLQMMSGKAEANEDEELIINPPKGPGLVGVHHGKLFYTDANRGAVGVYVIKDGKVLTGTRGSGDGQNLLCGPGGHIEDGEMPVQAAIRETQEEFGITPMELIPIGKGEKQSNGLQPDIFICVRYEGEPKCDDDEMHHPKFVAVEDLLTSGILFGPFESGLKAVVRAVKMEGADDNAGI